MIILIYKVSDYKLKQQIMKSQKQIEFQQCIKSMDMQLQIFQNPNSSAKLTETKYQQLTQKIKNLKKVFTQMDEKMKANMRNKNYNQYDIKNKLRKYLEGLQQINERYRKLQTKLVEKQKQSLMRNRQLNPDQSDDLRRAYDHLDRFQNVNRQANEVQGMYQNINQQVLRQRGVLDDITRDADQFQHQLSMSDQLMRVISNRTLITKLVIILLIFFLGLADLLILLVKVL